MHDPDKSDKDVTQRPRASLESSARALVERMMTEKCPKCGAGPVLPDGDYYSIYCWHCGWRYYCFISFMRRQDFEEDPQEIKTSAAWWLLMDTHEPNHDREKISEDMRRLMREAAESCLDARLSGAQRPA